MLYLIFTLFVVFAVISILYIFPDLKNNKENNNENNVIYIEENYNKTKEAVKNEKEVCNINKRELENKAKKFNLSYEIYEVKIPEV